MFQIAFLLLFLALCYNPPTNTHRRHEQMGRPSAYSDQIAEAILFRMAGGESVASICRDDDMPARSTVMLWIATDRENFSDRYAKACEARAHYWADELLDIADDASNDYMKKNDPENPGYTTNGEAIARSRLRVDSRKWLLSKMLPRYADKQEIDHKSTDGSMSPKADNDLSQLSTEDLQAIAELAKKISDPAG